MMGAAAAKKGGECIDIDWLEMFKATADDADTCFDSTPPPPTRKGRAKRSERSAASPSSADVCVISPPSAPAKRRRRRAEEEAGAEFRSMSNKGMRREVEDMSDGELQREIAGMRSFGGFLVGDKRVRHQRFLPLLEAEAQKRRTRKHAAKDAGDRNPGAPSRADVYAFDTEDEQVEDTARRFCPNSSPIRPKKKNYGLLGVQTRSSSNQAGLRKPIPTDKMYSSTTSPTPLRGHTMRVRAVDPKERDNEKSRQNGNNYYRTKEERRKAHHEDSSLLHQKVNAVVLLDDEDPQPDEPVECEVPDKWKDLKIYYPSSDNPEAVELSSSDIKCLNPGVYVSSPVINYYIQYIKRAEMHIEYGTDKFYMFNTYFYSKLQEALLDKHKFLKLRRWWKGVNIFQRGYIILPIHGMSHWSLIIVCMPAKESNAGPIILHLDSLGMHPSAQIFDTVGKYLEEEWRHLRENESSCISISETIWQDLPSNIHKEIVEVPGQNNAYDCGVFMLYYIQQFIKQAPERFTRDRLHMFSRSWFRSEVASGLRNGIRELLLELFGSARGDDILSEAAASDDSDEECIIKEGESEAVTPCDSSGMAAGGGDTSTRNEEDFMEGTPLTTRSSDGRVVACALSEAVMSSDSIDDDDTMKTDLDRSKTEQDIEIILPSDGSGMVVGGGGTSTRSSDGRIVACALSEEAMSSDSIDDDDTMRTDFDCSKTEQGVEILPSDGSGMPVGGGGTSTGNEEDFMEALAPLATRSSGARIIACALSEAATLSDGVDDDDTMKADSDSSKTEQCIVILSSDRSKNNEMVMHSTPDRTMYCSDSDVEEVKTPEVEKRRRRGELCCIV
ncbi:hypothetical protein QYE76_000791 [Lolium multiflorum]|uniref:Ubiquitin-like protease family profile domain-containing protein n=1 Tax=Lolium multiflorum TaxID=4521 RepID=A0AAD8VZ25_LOLMU|nr:hypothetical protein QYE76_000791 [Lolium multiflorum]